MNLIETIVASLIFSLSAAASLHLLDLVSVSMLELERRQELFERLETELVNFEGQLRNEVRLPAPLGNCRQASERLLLALQSSGPAPGLSRDLSLTASGEGLQLQLTVDGLKQPRQRQYYPAAFGLCPAALSAEVPHASS